MRLGLLVMMVMALAAGGADAQEQARIITVPTARIGVVQPILLVTPARPWDTAMILFVGKGGNADVQRNGAGGRGTNTLYRGMDILVREGLAAAIVDHPSDRSSLWNYRTTADHADDIAHVIGALKELGAKQVWLAGISMGSLSAASVAQRLKSDGPDGIVLLSSVINTNRESAETILQVPLEDIAVPTLVVRNPADGCKSSPPHGAERIMGRLEHAPVKRLMEFSGGTADRSGPCDALSAHGFIGLEDQVLSAIADWVKAPR
jgi:hypothetical protein